ncbi:MAG TPA: VanZ family protein [Burkholderiaceae bacterium]|nr:VanZ family protein [Burkholderiaceae bacterium]
MQEGPYDSLDPRPWRRRASPVARLACLAYTVLVIYASLTPWTGWRDLGVGAFAYLSAPWPDRMVRFDVIVNVLGYVPLGMVLVLALHPRVSGAAAILIAFVAGTLLSGSVEAVQTFIPRRVSSNVDLVTNVCGTLLGALVGAWRAEALIDRGRLLELRFAWFDRDSAIPLTLLALWPLTQIHAVAMLFAMGPSDAFLLDWLHEQGLAWLPPRGAWAPAEFVIAEAAVTTAGALSVGLAAAAAMRPLAPRARLLLAIIGAGLCAKSLAYGVRFGGEHALSWLTPGAVGGLAIGLLAAIVASWGPPRAVSRLALLATAGLVVAVSLIPENPYFDNWQSHWRTGKLAHFNALGEWVAFAWPFATFAWLAALQMERLFRRARPNDGN